MSDKYDWRYENSINYTKEYENVQNNEYEYSSWRTNTILSNYADTIMHSNMMNINYVLSAKMQYDYLFYSIKPKKRFFKNPKVRNREDFGLVKEYYKYNNERTKEALKILTKEQIEIIAQKQEKGGIK